MVCIDAVFVKAEFTQGFPLRFQVLAEGRFDARIATRLNGMMRMHLDGLLNEPQTDVSAGLTGCASSRSGRIRLTTTVCSTSSNSCRNWIFRRQGERYFTDGQLGRISAHEVHGQMKTSPCLTFILACIIYWQAREIIRLTTAPDFPFDPELNRQISLIEWKNVILHGEIKIDPEKLRLRRAQRAFFARNVVVPPLQRGHYWTLPLMLGPFAFGLCHFRRENSERFCHDLLVRTGVM